MDTEIKKFERDINNITCLLYICIMAFVVVLIISTLFLYRAGFVGNVKQQSDINCYHRYKLQNSTCRKKTTSTDLFNTNI